MKPYKNLSGGSSAAAYEIGPDFTRVQVTDGKAYFYSDATAGKATLPD
jgi:hypothetical protein